jgi:hypothetical protein
MDDSTRIGFKLRDHHRDRSVQNSITCLCIWLRASALQPCRGPWVLIVTILASGMAFIDGTAVNVALPALQTALHATVRTCNEWSRPTLFCSLHCCSYMAPLTIFMAARWSSSQVCCYCSWIGLVRVCSFDRLPHFARGLQGIGAAFLAPGSLAIISASYMEYELGQPIGSGLASRRSRPPSVRFLVG